MKLSDVGLDRNTPAQDTVCNFLALAPADEVYAPHELAEKLGVGMDTISRMKRGSQFAPYTATVGQRRYWGSPVAIQNLKRQVGQ